MPHSQGQQYVIYQWEQVNSSLKQVDFYRRAEEMIHIISSCWVSNMWTVNTRNNEYGQDRPDQKQQSHLISSCI